MASWYLLNSELLGQLAEAKLQSEAEEIETEGWKWVEVSQEGPYKTGNYHRIDAKPIDVPDELEQKLEDVCVKIERLEERDSDDWDDETEALCAKLDTEYERLEAEKDRYCAFTDEEKGRAGAIVTFDGSGEVRVIRGLVREEDRKAAVRNKDANAVDEAEASISNALRSDLDAFRQQAIQASLVGSPKVAADVLAYTVCSQFVESLPRWQSKPLSVSCEKTRYAEGKGFEDTRSAIALVEAKEKLNLEWAAHGTAAKRYEAFCVLTPKVKATLVAYASAQSFLAARVDDKDAATSLIVQQLGVDVAASWRPTAENYFKRLKGTDVLIEIGREWFGDVWVQKYRNEKKSVLVTHLHEAGNNAATRESLDASVLERIDAWLPEEIRD